MSKLDNPRTKSVLCHKFPLLQTEKTKHLRRQFKLIDSQPSLLRIESPFENREALRYGRYLNCIDVQRMSLTFGDSQAKILQLWSTLFE